MHKSPHVVPVSQDAPQVLTLLGEVRVLEVEGPHPVDDLVDDDGEGVDVCLLRPFLRRVGIPQDLRRCP